MDRYQWAQRLTTHVTIWPTLQAIQSIRDWASELQCGNNLGLRRSQTASMRSQEWAQVTTYKVRISKIMVLIMSHIRSSKFLFHAIYLSSTGLFHLKWFFSRFYILKSVGQTWYKVKKLTWLIFWFGIVLYWPLCDKKLV